MKRAGLIVLTLFFSVTGAFANGPERASPLRSPCAPLLLDSQDVLKFIPLQVSQPGPGLLPRGPQGGAYAAAYQLAVARLSGYGVKPRGVHGSLKLGRGRLGAWNPKEVSFSVAKTIDKSPFNREFWIALSAPERDKWVRVLDPLALAIKTSGRTLPSDIDLDIGDEQRVDFDDLDRIAREVFDATGVLIEWVKGRSDDPGVELQLNFAD